MSDTLLKLLFEKKNCRGVVLHMDAAWQSMVKNQKLPQPVKQILGEMCAGAVMLASGLKFDGALVLQLQGDGPVKLAIVEVRTGLIVRATAQLRVSAEAIPEDASFESLVNASGKGRCAIILDAKDRRLGEQPYQGIVVLENAGVAATLENYMTHSEQLETRLWLASNETACGGVMLQKLPVEGASVLQPSAAGEEDGLLSLALFAKTVKAEEICSLDADVLARRLFWEDNPRMIATEEPTFHCRCSKQGIEAMVKNLGEETARQILQEQGTIEVTCEFCGAHYVLDAVDVGALFKNGTTESASKSQN